MSEKDDYSDIGHVTIKYGMSKGSYILSCIAIGLGGILYLMIIFKMCGFW